MKTEKLTMLANDCEDRAIEAEEAGEIALARAWMSVVARIKDIIRDMERAP